MTDTPNRLLLQEMEQAGALDCNIDAIRRALESLPDSQTKSNQPVNLTLDLCAIDCHAQEYMRYLGITYEHATPQSIADCWWFWNCQNVPDPLPEGLTLLTVTPAQAIGYGLSAEKAKELEASATPQT